MGFHRFAVPVYSGGLPVGYDYINNATVGTPAVYDGALAAGLNAGSYFFGSGEQATTAAMNRGLKALAENTDYLDDLLRRDVAVPTIADFVAGGAPVGSIILTGPDVFIGKAGTPNTTEGIGTFVQVVDQNDNEIVASGAECKVTAISDTVGNGFSAGNVTLTISPSIPAGVAYRVYYAMKGNLATLPVDAFTSIKLRSAEEVPGELMASGGAALIGYAGGAAWADGTSNPNTSVESQLDKIVTDLAGAAGTAKVYGAAVAGSPFALSNGTLAAQMAYLLSSLNTNATNIAAEVNNRAIAVGYAIKPDARLTLQSGVAVSGADQVGKSTLYYTPLGGSVSGMVVPIYDGTYVVPRATVEISLALTGLISGTNYDVFAYWTGAAVALELGPAWTNATTRSTALDGFGTMLVKGGDPTRTYLGTIRTTSTTTTEDSAAKRFVWNYYNDRVRTLSTVSNTASWASTSAWRKTNGGADAQGDHFEYVCGIDGVALEAEAQLLVTASATGAIASTGVGLGNATNVAQLYGKTSNTTIGSDSTHARYRGTPGIGYRDIWWLEYGSAGSVSFNGVAATWQQSGMTGAIRG